MEDNLRTRAAHTGEQHPDNSVARSQLVGFVMLVVSAPLAMMLVIEAFQGEAGWFGRLALAGVAVILVTGPAALMAGPRARVLLAMAAFMLGSLASGVGAWLFIQSLHEHVDNWCLPIYGAGMLLGGLSMIIYALPDWFVRHLPRSVARVARRRRSKLGAVAEAKSWKSDSLF